MPNKSTKETIDYIIGLLSKIDGADNQSVLDTREMLEAMSEDDLDAYFRSMKPGGEIIGFVAPNFYKRDSKISLDKILTVGEELGHNFFERLWLTDSKTGNVSLTPIEYFVGDGIIRRQQQHLAKKISIAPHNRIIDELTGQVTGASKSSALSSSEVFIMYSHGLTQSIRELYKFRGGDEKGYRKLTRDIKSNGMPSMNAVDDGTTRPTAIVTLRSFLNAMHLANTVYSV